MRLPIDSLRTDGGTQPRGMIDFTVVQDYAEEMKAGAAFPPVVVFYDGADHWLADGFHRAKAARAAGQSEIECDVRQGTRADAVWFSCGANRAHGLQRTNADKRRAVETALRLRPNESNRAIAAHVGVSDPFVGEVKRQLLTVSSSPSVGRDGKTRTTTPEKQAAGGKASAEKRAAAKAETPARPDPFDAPTGRTHHVGDDCEGGLVEQPPAPQPAKPVTPAPTTARTLNQRDRIVAQVCDLIGPLSVADAEWALARALAYHSKKGAA